MCVSLFFVHVLTRVNLFVGCRGPQARLHLAAIKPHVFLTPLPLVGCKLLFQGPSAFRLDGPTQQQHVALISSLPDINMWLFDCRWNMSKFEKKKRKEAKGKTGKQEAQEVENSGGER